MRGHRTREATRSSPLAAAISTDAFWSKKRFTRTPSARTPMVPLAKSPDLVNTWPANNRGDLLHSHECQSRPFVPR